MDPPQMSARGSGWSPWMSTSGDRVERAAGNSRHRPLGGAEGHEGGLGWWPRAWGYVRNPGWSLPFLAWDGADAQPGPLSLLGESQTPLDARGAASPALGQSKASLGVTGLVLGSPLGCAPATGAPNPFSWVAVGFWEHGERTSGVASPQLSLKWFGLIPARPWEFITFPLQRGGGGG